MVEHGHGGTQAPVSGHVTVHVSRGTCPHLAVSRRKVLFCSTEARRSASAASIPRRARVGRLGRTRVTCCHYTRVTPHIITTHVSPDLAGVRPRVQGSEELHEGRGVAGGGQQVQPQHHQPGGGRAPGHVYGYIYCYIYCYLLSTIYYVSTPGLWQPPHQLALLLCVVQEPAGRAAEPQPAAGTLLASLLQGDTWSWSGSTPAPAPGPGGDTRSRSQVQSAQTAPAAAPCPPAPPATILNTKYPGHILDNLTWPPCISCSARSPLPAPCTVTRLARGVALPRVSSAHWAASSLSRSMCPGPVSVSPVSSVHMSRQNTSDSTLSHPELSP